MRIRKSWLLASIMLAAVPAAAQMPQDQPIAAPAEPDAIPLYGAATPGKASTEMWGEIASGRKFVRNVTRPTLTPVLPDPAKANGAAVIVAPGGAFVGLAISHEGWDVARALADRGFTAFVLKYRLIPTPVDKAAFSAMMRERMATEVANPMQGTLLRDSQAPADARAAIAMVRSGAAKWNIDPARIGIIGFSAGAMTARRVAIDAPAAERPDFVGYIYGPQDGETVPADAPPLFDAIALDDGTFPLRGFAVVEAWKAAGRPVEIHGYQTGNHGFGLGNPGQTNRLMIDQFVTWLDMQGFLKPKATP